jgi:uncharacterized protein DUF4157
MFAFDRKRTSSAAAPSPKAASPRPGTQSNGAVNAGTQVSRGGLPCYLQQTKDTGDPLDASLRRDLEASFGASLGHVRVVTDDNAGRAARDLGASAFSWQSSIWFGVGKHDPVSASGRRLIAHEVAHTLQSAGRRSDDVTTGDPGDASERDADRAAVAFMRGERAHVAASTPALRCDGDPGSAPPPPVAWGSGWFPSQGGPIPGVTNPPSAPQNVFEDPAAQTSAGAPAAFTKYKALASNVRKLAFDISYPNGNLAKALSALKTAGALDTYADEVAELLRWTEGYEARKESGKTDDEMVKIQKAHIEAKPNAGGPGLGGTKKTRWGDLRDEQKKKRWTERGNAAIAKMVAYAATNAPDLKLTAKSFELEFAKIDNESLGAIAAGGSKPGETLYIGFEFIVLVELNPAYALSTVAHELLGHPTYNKPGRSYQGTIYDKAKAGVTNAPSGNPFAYFPSEIYSLLRELPYWTQVSTADDKRVLDVVDEKAKPSDLNYDPRDAIKDWLARSRQAWAPSLFVPMVRGFYKRIQIDPAIKPMALSAFQAIIKSAYPVESAQILP